MPAHRGVPRVGPLAVLAVGATLAWGCASGGAGGPGRGSGAPFPAAPRATPEQLGAVPGVAKRRVVAYIFGRRALGGMRIPDIRGDRLTHLVYAFADIGADGLAALDDPCIDLGRCAAGERNPYPEGGGSFAALRRLKERYPHLKVLVSFGGWARSAHFSDAAATPESRRAFIDSAVELVLRRYPGVFDGFDLDWEFPVRDGLPTNTRRPDDGANYVALVEELRARLDLEGARDHARYLLTIAGPAGAGRMAEVELARMAAALDWVNVMAYDFHSGGNRAHFNAPLFAAPDDPTPSLTVDWTVRAYRALGIPGYKIVVGVPFYGVGYAGVSAEADGRFQPLRGDTTAAPGGSRSWGVGDFRYDLVDEAIRRGFHRSWDDAAGVPWLHDPATGVFITYEDPRSLRLKGDYVVRHDLGGIMIWEIGGDPDGRLLRAVTGRLRR